MESNWTGRRLQSLHPLMERRQNQAMGTCWHLFYVRDPRSMHSIGKLWNSVARTRVRLVYGARKVRKPFTRPISGIPKEISYALTASARSKKHTCEVAAFDVAGITGAP